MLTARLNRVAPSNQQKQASVGIRNFVTTLMNENLVKTNCVAEQGRCNVSIHEWPMQNGWDHENKWKFS